SQSENNWSWLGRVVPVGRGFLLPAKAHFRAIQASVPVGFKGWPIPALHSFRSKYCAGFLHHWPALMDHQYLNLPRLVQSPPISIVFLLVLIHLAVLLDSPRRPRSAARQHG